MRKLTVLGKTVRRFTRLETFPTPECTTLVRCESDEVTAVCPVTGQPDWYKVSITYEPGKKCLESKSLKLYLQSFRNRGIFCEALASEVAHQLLRVLEARSLAVEVVQKPRGGVSITARTALWGKGKA